MRGLYRIYKNNELITEKPNLLTAAGKRVIVGYLAGTIPSWAGIIVAGVGATTPTVNDTTLAYQIASAPIQLRQPDYATNRVILRASVDASVAGKFYETGLYADPQPFNSMSSSTGIVNFNSDLFNVSGGTDDTTYSRVDARSRRANSGTGATTTISLLDTFLDLSSYRASDKFKLAAYIADANTSSINVRFLVDASNYFSYTITPGATTGYRIFEWTKSAFTSVGTPVWTGITQIDVRTTAGAAATAVHYDGLRIEAMDSFSDYALVSRSVLGSPISKTVNEQVDIEYVLEFTI